jgi:hypothetical protein
MVGSDGASEWTPWDGEEDDIDAIMNAMSERNGPAGGCSLEEEIFWNESGIEYWTEVREVQ